MMREMEAVEPSIFHIGKPDVKDEEEVRVELTRAELIERNRELRRVRMKESQQSAKAHRQNKIKSKKFHRILKKEKMKQQIKEFELLQKTDPEAALRKIEQLDRNRVEERANQRHRNTGTWAKNLQVRAKYNKEVRKELADQITISRELTAKKQIDESDEEDDNDAENDPNFDPFNPWLKKQSENEQGDVDELLGGYRQYWLDRNENNEQTKEYRNAKPTGRTAVQAAAAAKTSEQAEASESSGSWTVVRTGPTKKAQAKPSSVNKGWVEEDLDASVVIDDIDESSSKRETSKIDNLDDFFDDAEDALKDKFSKKALAMQMELNSKRKNNRQRKRTGKDDTEIDLTFKQRNKRPKIDEELNADDLVDESGMAAVIQTAKNKLVASKGQSSGEVDNINPDEFAKVQPRHLHTALPDTIYTNDEDDVYENDDVAYENDETRRLTLAEAFEDDDIVAQFERDKEEEAKKNGPQEIDMSLPGWGSWGGSGIDPAKQRPKRRLVLKFPAAEKRRPENEGSVVIIENGDEKLKKHRVANLPFPFTSVADYEQSIRAPLGNDFMPVTAHKLLTKPSVTTRLGTIIDPMNENMLVKPAREPVSKTARKIATLEEDKY